MTSRRGFTLLEVLVAVAILGLGLTTILSAQTGIFASSERTEKLSFAVGLLRCRMSELEVDLMKVGYPVADVTQEGPCCEDERDETFTCSWKIETVLLPEAGGLGGTADGGAPPSAESGMGAVGALAAVAQTEGRVLGSEPDLGSLADLMGGESVSSQSMAPMVMSLVYPNLKPMLEASIRRLTVSVKWKEGSRDRDLTVTQFVTRPQQGGFDQATSDAVDQMGDMISTLSGEITSQTSSGTGGASSAGGKP